MPDLIGQPMDRIDGRLKVMGRATYADEHQIPNAAYAVMITSSIAKGRIVSMDTGAAEQAPGVLLVMTHLNAMKLPQLESQKKSPPVGRVVQVLQDDVVRYANQPLGVVVGETLEAAMEGARLVQVHYAPETPHVDLESRESEAFTPEKVGGANDPATSHRGDMQTGLSEAAKRHDAAYWTPFEVHNPDGAARHHRGLGYAGPSHFIRRDARGIQRS